MERRLGILKFAFSSLLGEILLWLLLLFFLLWALSVLATYQVANSVANRPYDEQLSGDIAVLAKRVSYRDGRVTVGLSKGEEELIRAQSGGHVYLQVLGPKGEVAFGDPELPWLDPSDIAEAGKLYFRDETLGDEDIRIAYQLLQESPEAPPLLLQIAETRQRRQALAAGMVSGVIVPQFVVIPITVLLVFLALTRGMTPLQRLQDELRRRRPSNLTPIDVKGLPLEIRPLIEALNDVMTRLDSTLGTQRRFIADAAHQLKTPLTGLRSQIELIQDEHDAAALSRGVRNIAQSTESLSRLVHQLLSLARAEATADRGVAFENVDLNRLAREVAGEAAGRALAKRIDLGFEAFATPVWLAGTPILLQEMLRNLVDNAIKYTPDGGHVTVRIKNFDTPVLEVEDSGVGIPVEEREKVFNRFYRMLGHDTDGSGLGLSIVKEIADLHEASLAIESVDGANGTRFRVQFPSRDGATLASN